MESRPYPCYRFILVVLTYRNADDLLDFDRSLKSHLNGYHVIVVNSHFDEQSEDKIKRIADLLGYDYIGIENRGYGFGNNRGIEYANAHYTYEYLIVSNPDVIIRRFDDSSLPFASAIIGPAITTVAGKSQNPYWAIRSGVLEECIYLGMKRNSRMHMIFAEGINRLIRELYLVLHRKSRKAREVYATHGAFVIFTRDVIEKLDVVYDEDMFLFYEEAYLANRIRQYNIRQYFYPAIDILHKEDGSTRGMNIDLSRHARQSFVYYYENRLRSART